MFRASAITVLAIIPIAVAVGGQAQTRDGRSGFWEADAVETQFDQETWRIGGPRREEILRIFRFAVESDRKPVTEEAWRQISILRESGLVDDALFSECLRIDWAARPVQEGSGRPHQVSFNLLEDASPPDGGEETREASVRFVLQSRGVRRDPEYPSVSWCDAAVQALRLELDDLLPQIEADLLAQRSPASRSREGANREAYIRDVLIPLAQQRRSGDWARGYLELLSSVAETQNTKVSQPDTENTNRLAREALLRLVLKGEREAVPTLCRMWQGLQQASAAQAVPSSRIPLARNLLKAIRALDGNCFDESAWKAAFPSPGSASCVAD